jgi:hypothetical protein
MLTKKGKHECEMGAATCVGVGEAHSSRACELIFLALYMNSWCLADYSAPQGGEKVARSKTVSTTIRG